MLILVMRKLLKSFALFFLTVALSPKHAPADELVPCVNEGVELGHDFAVSVKHEGKALAGVRIDVTRGRWSPKEEIIKSSLTGLDGLASITALPAGNYWVSAGKLGIGAAYHCFHVDENPSRRTRRSVEYEWGYGAPLIRGASGRLVDTQPGRSENPRWNLLHAIDVPISGADLRLSNARTGEVFKTTTDDHGDFDFGPIQEGTYVLHSEGGKTGRLYEPTDLLLKISSAAKISSVVLKRTNPSALTDASLRFYWDELQRPQFR